jgi:hypothetical protein
MLTHKPRTHTRIHTTTKQMIALRYSHPLSSSQTPNQHHATREHHTHPQAPPPRRHSNSTGMNHKHSPAKKTHTTPRTPHPHTTNNHRSPRRRPTNDHRSRRSNIDHPGGREPGHRACLLRTQQYAVHPRPTHPLPPLKRTRGNTRIGSTFVMIHP